MAIELAFRVASCGERRLQSSRGHTLSGMPPLGRSVTRLMGSGACSRPTRSARAHQRRQDGDGLHHRKRHADAGARAEAERHELRARVFRFALGREPIRVEAVGIVHSAGGGARRRSG